MANDDLNWIANDIWGIADDVLRDLYMRTLAEIRADVVALEEEIQGLHEEIVRERGL